MDHATRDYLQPDLLPGMAQAELGMTNSAAHKGPDDQEQLASQLATAQLAQDKLHAELQDAKNQLRTLLDSAPEAIVILDAQTGSFVDANPRAEELFGFSRTELLQKGPFQLSPEFQPDGSRSAEQGKKYVETALGGEMIQFEWIHCNATGQEILCSVQLVRLPWKDRSLVRGSVTNITSQRRAELALRNSEELNRRILETVAGGIVHVALDGSILKANSEAQRLLGLSLNELTNRYVQDFARITLREDGTACPVEEYPVSRCLQTMQTQPPMTIGVQHPSGELSWAIYSATPVFDPYTGQGTGVVVTFLDITQRKQAEQAMLDMHNELENIMVSISDCLWSAVINPSGQFYYRYYSPVVQQLTGRPPEFFISNPQKWLSIIHTEDVDYLKQLLENVLSGQSMREEAEYRICLPDGSTRWVRDSVLVWKQADGSRRIDGVMSDITERKRLEALRQQAADELERLVQERTAALTQTNNQLQLEITERMAAQQKLLREQDLLRRLFHLQEEERQLASYQVHDGVVQYLVGAKMLLDSCQRPDLDVPTPILQLIERASTQLRTAIERGRRLIDHLRPMVIDELGLVASIQFLIAETNSQGVQACLELDGNFEAVPEFLAETAFRIVQAALRNVCQHSQAEHAQVRLCCTSQLLTVEIIDSGQGFDPLNIPVPCFGIRSIQERTRLLGGQTQLKSSPHEGTRLLVELPYSPV